jgi:hypothetical protein
VLWRAAMSDALTTALEDRCRLLDTLEPHARAEYEMLFGLYGNEPEPIEELPQNVILISRVKRSNPSKPIGLISPCN